MTISVDEAQLERIVRDRKFDPRTLEIARRLFIHNERPKLLAAEYGVIFQRIYAIRKAVLDAIEEDALAPGHSQLVLRGPAGAVEAARRAYDKWMERAGEGRTGGGDHTTSTGTGRTRS